MAGKPKVREGGVRNSITIDLVDNFNGRDVKVLEKGFNTGHEAVTSSASIIPRVRSSKPVRASSRQSQDSVKKINLSTSEFD